MARDSFGRPLPDAKFRWFVRGSGNGTLTESRDGKTATLLHRIDVAGLTGYGSGACQMVAVGLIGGRRVEGVSGPLDLP